MMERFLVQLNPKSVAAYALCLVKTENAQRAIRIIRDSAASKRRTGEHLVYVLYDLFEVEVYDMLKDPDGKIEAELATKGFIHLKPGQNLDHDLGLPIGERCIGITEDVRFFVKHDGDYRGGYIDIEFTDYDADVPVHRYADRSPFSLARLHRLAKAKPHPAKGA